ncbi:MAG: nicotinate phosphoribosyltransferase [Alphaproteobacteria bacterium]|nr:nicotinate phosphoribosyltransferase [Alphaproteobacteria bacterium]
MILHPYGYQKILDDLVNLTLSAGPVSALTDKYFSYARRTAENFGDVEVVYAVFLRRRVIAALEPAICLIRKLAPQAQIISFFEEGSVVPSERKLLEVRGSYAELSELETLILQKVGFPCVCANNTYELCKTLPSVSFIDMHARHATGPEMSLLAAYGASVGSAAAQSETPDIRGFIGSSQDMTAPFFGKNQGMGTIPHALVGYAGGDIVSALEKFERAMPDLQTLVALVDYQGLEVTDSIRSAHWFFNHSGLETRGKTLGIRLDTHGSRFAEGLDYEKSIDVVSEWLGVEGEYNIVEYVMGRCAFQIDSNNTLVDQIRRILFGKGVSIASIFHIRRALDEKGFRQVILIASSGFDVFKCLVTGAVRAPVDVVGTGSYLPSTWEETYATADVISYDGKNRVKLGREHLFERKLNEPCLEKGRTFFRKET